MAQNKTITIGYVLDDTLDRSDGVQAAVMDIGEEMRRRGQNVHYLVTETKKRNLQNIQSVGTYLELPFNGNSVRTPKPLTKRKIDRLFKDIHFDVLHVQMPHSPFFAGRILKSAPADTKIVGTFHVLPHGVFAAYGTWLLGRFLKASIRRIDHAFAVSKPALRFMEQTFFVTGPVLPNPVVYASYRSFTRQKKSKTQMVYVGRLEERKGARELQAAFMLLPDQVRHLC